MPEENKKLGGPTAREGKAKSSQKSTRNGMFSQTLILPGETLEAYEDMQTKWLADFEPSGYEETTPIDILIRNHWLLMRAHRRLLETERALAATEDPNPAEWRAEQEHKIELMQRYETTAEQRFTGPETRGRSCGRTT